MNVGLIARADNRGLGMMTWAFHRAMRPAKTLLVELGPNTRRGFESYPERYPDATVVDWDGDALDEPTVRGWLEGLDVVYSAETFYDVRLVDWAEQAGVATVLHVMPEFYRADVRPTVVWTPTSWRRDTLPDETRLVPVPVEDSSIRNTDSRFRDEDRESGPLRLVHVAGHRATGDRNGTLIVLQALRMVHRPVDVRIFCQDQRMPTARGIPSRIRLTTKIGGVADRWSQYEDADLLVLPRRYGGLCLPVHEAAAAGLGLVLSATSPNGDWPAMLLHARPGGSVRTAAGEIGFANVDPRILATAIDSLAQDPGSVDRLRRLASGWADDHSWGKLRPLYETELAAAT